MNQKIIPRYERLFVKKSKKVGEHHTTFSRFQIMNNVLPKNKKTVDEHLYLFRMTSAFEWCALQGILFVFFETNTLLLSTSHMRTIVMKSITITNSIFLFLITKTQVEGELFDKMFTLLHLSIQNVPTNILLFTPYPVNEYFSLPRPTA